MTSQRTPAEPGILYVVATPIGNLADMSQRAIEVLKQVDWIACEDTRHSRRLLEHFGILTPTISYHDHNEDQRSDQLQQRLLNGQNIALISDAGTPVISDPGYRLVRAARQNGTTVLAVPGPNAALSALSISGLPSDQFLFLGFPPRGQTLREQMFLSVRSFAATQIWYLSPHRLRDELASFRKILGDREALLVREMTKLHEQSYWGPLSRIEEEVSGAGRIKGELTLVVTGVSRAEPAQYPIDIEAYLMGLIQHRGLSRREAASRAARELNRSSRELYRLSL